MSQPNGCDELMSFQFRAAQGWLSRAAQSSDIYAKFFFYFSGFNALFFLWSRIDGVNGDAKEIKNMLGKFDETKAKELLAKSYASVGYFSHRNPVARMDRRTCADPYGFDEKEGTKWKEILDDQTKSSTERLISLGEIIYLVRSNLIHGSRVPVHDSEAIPNCLEPLKILLEESIELTRTRLSPAPLVP